MALISYEDKIGTPIQSGSIKLRPVSRVLQITPPGWNAGIIWNRPVAIQIENEQGEIQELPIQDATRQALMLFAAFGLAFAFLTSLVRRGKSKK